MNIVWHYLDKKLAAINALKDYSNMAYIIEHARWRRARLRYLRQHPLCVECDKQGMYKAATVVDHIKPHKGNFELFWDEGNWQPLCKRCHDRKTALEDSNFLRTRS